MPSDTPISAKPGPNRKRRIAVRLLGIVAALALAMPSAHAETSHNWNIPAPTLGGNQVWADGYVHAGWRVQQNVLTGHWRLLDPKNIRRAWGNYDDCRTAFDTVRDAGGLKPVSPHMVMIIHGISPRPMSLAHLQSAIGDAGYDAIAISYPSTRDRIENHALPIEQLLDRSTGTTRISFVTHSMGGLVLRHLLSRDGAWKRRIRIGRIVQIAPPNRGAAAADMLSGLPPYRWIFGRSGQQLTPAAAADIPRLNHRFAVIAGGKGDGEGFNPLLPGDDDGTVRVAETNLPGMADFLLIDDHHTGLLGNPKTYRATVHYLVHGAFAK